MPLLQKIIIIPLILVTKEKNVVFFINCVAKQPPTFSNLDMTLDVNYTFGYNPFFSTNTIISTVSAIRKSK
jgi:hypothetical protein